MELIVGQLKYVFASFFLGIFLMFLYDFLLAHRDIKKIGKILLFIEDWIFWGISAIFVFQMIFQLNNGILRSFFVIAFLLGMTGYRKVVGNTVQKAIKTVVTFVSRPYVWLKRKIKKIQKKFLKS